MHPKFLKHFVKDSLHRVPDVSDMWLWPRKKMSDTLIGVPEACATQVGQSLQQDSSTDIFKTMYDSSTDKIFLSQIV